MSAGGMGGPLGGPASPPALPSPHTAELLYLAAIHGELRGIRSDLGQVLAALVPRPAPPAPDGTVPLREPERPQPEPDEVPLREPEPPPSPPDAVPLREPEQGASEPTHNPKRRARGR